MKSKIPVYIFTLIIVTYWFTFIDKIGLHGDEAWFGLEGIKILDRGILRLWGLNNYTGILQSYTNSIMFRFFDPGVVQMRLAGILCNSISLIFLVWYMGKRANPLLPLFFLMLFAQSALYLCFSKVAWEICSFNFLFGTIAVVTLYESARREGRASHFLRFLFLLTAFLGVYNHIIFSALLLSVFIGLLMWLLLAEIKPDRTLVSVFSQLLLSLVNAVLLFIIMRSYIDGIWFKSGQWIFLFPIILILLECFAFQKITLIVKLTADLLSKIKINIYLKKTLPFLFLLPFIRYQAITIIQIFGQEIILIRVFSYELNYFLKIVLMITSSVILAFTAYALIKDILKRSSALWAYILLAYMGVLSFYTHGHSIRYFLTLTLLLFLYASYKLSQETRMVRNAIIVVIALNVIIIQSILWNINLDKDRSVKATMFKIENFSETSAHFLNFSPVLDIVHKHKIGELDTKQDYFIGKVFNFYKNEYPEINAYKNRLRIDYDYEVKGSGFKMDTTFANNQ